MLFPGGALPLHVFEERYRELVRSGREFGIVSLRAGLEVGESEVELHDVGTAVRVDRRVETPDGRFNLLCRGTRRFRIAAVADAAAPYLVAAVDWLPDDPEPAPPALAALLQEYLRQMDVAVILQHSPEFEARGVWLAGSLLQVEPAKLQPLLETGSAELAVALLEEEVDRLRNLGKLGSFRPVVPAPN